MHQKNAHKALSQQGNYSTSVQIRNGGNLHWGIRRRKDCTERRDIHYHRANWSWARGSRKYMERIGSWGGVLKNAGTLTRKGKERGKERLREPPKLLGWLEALGLSSRNGERGNALLLLEAGNSSKARDPTNEKSGEKAEERGRVYK